MLRGFHILLNAIPNAVDLVQPITNAFVIFAQLVDPLFLHVSREGTMRVSLPPTFTVLFVIGSVGNILFFGQPAKLAISDIFNAAIVSAFRTSSQVKPREGLSLFGIEFHYAPFIQSIETSFLFPNRQFLKVYTNL